MWASRATCSKDVDHFEEQGENSVLAKTLSIDVFESALRSYRVPITGCGESTLTANASSSQHTGRVSFSYRPAYSTMPPGSTKQAAAGFENV